MVFKSGRDFSHIFYKIFLKFSSEIVRKVSSYDGISLLTLLIFSRKHIDAGHLTFWNHEKMCTGRCQARTAMRPDAIVVNPPPTSYQPPVTLLTTTAENGTMKIQVCVCQHFSPHSFFYKLLLLTY